MVSKNNIFNHSKQKADGKQRFTIKKFTVGCASVLIGTTIYVGSANADVANVSSTDVSVETVDSGDDEKGESKDDSDLETSTDIVSSDTLQESNETEKQDNVSEELLNNSGIAEVENTSDTQDASNEDKTNSLQDTSVDTGDTQDAPVETENNTKSKAFTSGFRRVAEASPVADTSVTLNDGTTVSSDSPVLSEQNSTVNLNFNSNNFKAGDVYTITIPKLIVNTQPVVSALPSSLGTSKVTSSGDNWVITNTFIGEGSVSQDIKIKTIQKPAIKSYFFDRDNFGTGIYNPNQVLGVDIIVSKNGSDDHTLNLSYTIPDTYKDSVRVSTPVSVDVLYNKTPYNFSVSYTGGLLGSSDSLSPSAQGSTAWLNATTSDLVFKVSVPEYFVLNKDAGLGLYRDTTHETFKMTDYELSQDGAGSDIIVKIKNTSNFYDRPFDMSGIRFDFVGQMEVPDDLLTGASTRFAPKEKSFVTADFNNGSSQKGSDFMMPTLIVKPKPDSISTGDSIAVSYRESGNYVEGNGSSDVIKDDTGKTIADPSYTARFSVSNIGISSFDDVMFKLDYADGLLPNYQNISWDNSLASLTKAVVHYSDGSTKLLEDVKNNGYLYLSDGNKVVDYVELTFDKFNPGDRVIFGNLDYKLAKNYKDGTVIKEGDVLKSKLSVLGNTFEQSDLIYPKEVEKLGLFSYISLSQKSMAPGEKGASNVEVRWRDYSGYKFNVKNPILYIKLPNNSVLGDTLKVTDGAYANYEPKEVSVLTIDSIKYLKVDLSNYDSISDVLNVKFDLYNLFDGQTSTDKLYSYITSSNTADIKGHYNDFNVGTGNGNADIKNVGSLIAKAEGLDVNLLFAANDSRDYSLLVSKGVFGSEFSKGNLANDVALNTNTDSHKGDTFDMYSSVINATDNALTNVHSFVNIPQLSDGSSQFDTELTGPITVIDSMTGNVIDTAEVKYSTTAVDIDSNVKPDVSSFVSADQITDWSTVKSAVMILPTLVGGMTARMVVPLKDRKIYDNAGKSVYLASSTNADGLNSFVITAGSKASSKVTVVGESTIKVALDVVDKDGKATRIDIPSLDKKYSDLVSTMNRSDFPTNVGSIPADILAQLPENYVIDFENPTIENSNNSYLNGYANDVAKFGEKVQYYFDGDTVVFTVKTAESVTNTKTVKRTINYVDEQGNKLADSVVQSVEFSRTGVKNPFTGEVEWNAWSEDKTVDSVDSPEINNYSTETKVVDSLTINATWDDSVVDVVYVPKTEEVSEEKTVKRTIYHINHKYEDATVQEWLINGLSGYNSHPVEQTVTFTRTGSKNLVTGDIVWNDWTSDNNTFAEYKPSEYLDSDGKSVDAKDSTWRTNLEFINSLTVTADTENIDVAVPYWKRGSSTICIYAYNGPESDLENMELLSDDSYDGYGYPEDIFGVDGNWAEKRDQALKKIEELKAQGWEVIENDPINVSSNDTENVKYFYGLSDNALSPYEEDITKGYFVLLKHRMDTVKEDVTFDLTVNYKKVPYDDAGNDKLDGNTNEYYATLDTLKDPVNKSVKGVKTTVTDAVTGESTVTYEWDEDALSVDNPQNIDGYSLYDKNDASTDISSDEYVENGSMVKYILYTADTIQIKIQYEVIDDEGEVLDNLSEDFVSGRTGQTVDYSTKDKINGYENDGYDLVLDGTPQEHWQFDPIKDFEEGAGDGYRVYHVTFKQGMEEVSESKEVKRTINYVYAGDKLHEKDSQASESVEQLVTLTRNGVKNKVTGDITWNDWSVASFDGVVSPEIKGYVPDISEISEMNVTSDSTDAVQTVVYKGAEQKIVVNYIDEDTNTTLKTDNLTGLTGESTDYSSKDTIDNFVGQGYEFVRSELDGFDGVFKPSDETPVYNVYFKHKHEPVVDNTEPKRTIHYVDESGNKVFEDNVISTKFTATGSKDMVTGEISWGPWNEVFAWPSVDSPEKAGYTPDKSVVNEFFPMPDMPDVEETVVYRADKQSIVVNYIDKTTGITMKTDSLDGKTDEKIDYDDKLIISDFEAKNYILVDNELDGFNYVYGAWDEPKVFNIYFEHKTEHVDESKTVSRNISYVDVNGNKLFDNVDEVVSFTRTGIKDLVTGDINWDSWSDNKDFSEVLSPTKVGYTPDKSVVSSEVVTPDSEDFKIVVTYLQDSQRIIVNYVDEITGETLKSDDLVGKTGEDAGYTTKSTIDDLVAKNYVLVSDDTDGKSLVYDSDTLNDQVYTVVLSHAKEPVSETKNINRIIHYVNESGNKVFDDVPQIVIYTRSGSKDLVIGDVTWNEFISESPVFSKVVSPEKVGYTANTLVVDEMDVPVNTGDSEVYVVYSTNEQDAVITFIDDVSGKVIDKMTSVGKFGTLIEFENNVSLVISELTKKGYIMVSNTFDGQNYDSDNNKNVFEVHLTHGFEDVTEDHVVTRTINFVDSNGKVVLDSVVDTVKLTRSGIKDVVTGEITWNDSANGVFDTFLTPNLDGYSKSLTVIDGTIVEFSSDDEEYTVVYTPVEVPDKETPDKEIPDKEIPDKEIPDKEIPDKEVPDKEILNKDVPEKEAPNKEVSKKDNFVKVFDSKKVASNSENVVGDSVEELPQMGDDKSNLSLLGLMSLSLAGLFGLASKKRKEEE